MKLPDWAHYCERCGARVTRAAQSGDPLDRVGLDDTSSSEPIWPDDAEPTQPAAAKQPTQPSLVDVRGVTQPFSKEQLLQSMTKPIDMAEILSDEASRIQAEGEELEAEYLEVGERMGFPVEDEAGSAAGSGAQVTQALDPSQMAALAAQETDEPGDTDGPSSQVPDEASSNEGDAKGQPEQPEEAPQSHKDAGASSQEKAQDKAQEEPEETDEQHEEPQREQADRDDLAEQGEKDERGDTGDASAGGEDATRVVSQAVAPLSARRPRSGGQDGDFLSDISLHRTSPKVWDRQRPSERHGGADARPLTGAVVVGTALLLGFLVAYLVFGRATAALNGTIGSLRTEHLSQEKATEVIQALNGWWTTDRTFDGRYWHIQDGVIETYAADGILAKQVLIDPNSVEHMGAGPGGIEGEGYYLKNVAYYQVIAEPDVLHAIDGDGTAAEDANLFRSEAPAFMSGEAHGGDSANQTDAADASEYMLPESATRVLDASDLEGMSDHDLFVARNEIYARHGYTFETGELSEYFSSKSWYHPTDIFNEGDISEVERQNISTILSVEQSRGSQYV